MAAKTAKKPPKVRKGTAQPKPKRVETTEQFEKRVKKAISYLAAVNLPAFTTMLQVGEIVVADDPQIPTAALVKERNSLDYKIVLNPEFCSQWNNKELAGILLHECLHHVMRHLELPQFPDPRLANIVQDSFINRTIHETDSTLISWARKFYDEATSPALFLRPRSKPAEVMDKQMYRHLYKGKISEVDLYNYLERKCSSQSIMSCILVGSHGQGDQDGAGDNGDEKGEGPSFQGDENPIPIEEVPELVRDLKEKLRARNSESGGKLAGNFDRLLENFIKVHRLERNPTLEDAFRLSLVDSIKAEVLTELLGDTQEYASQSVLMPQHPSRDDMIQTAMGIPLIFWKNPEYGEKQGEVRVYVDVSGSVDAYKDWIYGVILSLDEYLATEVYLFSNEVVEITIGEFAQGKVVTTGGTSFDVICEHLMEKDVEKAVIVTDGYASMTPENIAKIKQKNVEIFSVVIGEGRNYYRNAVEEFSKKVFNLPLRD